MNDELARHLARVAFRTCRELRDALDLLRSRLPPDKYEPHAREVARAIDAVMTALIERPLADRPAIRAEIEASIARHGRYL